MTTTEPQDAPMAFDLADFLEYCRYLGTPNPKHTGAAWDALMALSFSFSRFGKDGRKETIEAGLDPAGQQWQVLPDRRFPVKELTAEAKGISYAEPADPPGTITIKAAAEIGKRKSTFEFPIGDKDTTFEVPVGSLTFAALLDHFGEMLGKGPVSGTLPDILQPANLVPVSALSGDPKLQVRYVGDPPLVSCSFESNFPTCLKKTVQCYLTGLKAASDGGQTRVLEVKFRYQFGGAILDRKVSLPSSPLLLKCIETNKPDDPKDWPPWIEPLLVSLAVATILSGVAALAALCAFAAALFGTPSEGSVAAIAAAVPAVCAVKEVGVAVTVKVVAEALMGVAAISIFIGEGSAGAILLAKILIKAVPRGAGPRDLAVALKSAGGTKFSAGDIATAMNERLDPKPGLDTISDALVEAYGWLADDVKPLVAALKKVSSDAVEIAAAVVAGQSSHGRTVQLGSLAIGLEGNGFPAADTARAVQKALKAGDRDLGMALVAAYRYKAGDATVLARALQAALDSKDDRLADAVRAGLSDASVTDLARALNDALGRREAGRLATVLAAVFTSARLPDLTPPALAGAMKFCQYSCPECGRGLGAAFPKLPAGEFLSALAVAFDPLPPIDDVASAFHQAGCYTGQQAYVAMTPAGGKKLFQRAAADAAVAKVFPRQTFALALDTGYVYARSHESYNFDRIGDFCLQAMLKANPGAPRKGGQLIYRHDADDVAGYDLAVNEQSTIVLNMASASGDAYSIASQEPVEGLLDGKPHKLEAAYQLKDGKEPRCAFFVDGVVVPLEGTPRDPCDISNDGPLCFGNPYGEQSSCPSFAGEIHWVRLWKVARPESGAASADDALVGSWPLPWGQTHDLTGVENDFYLEGKARIVETKDE